MNPLVQGLFNKFRETEELLKLSDADAFELFSTSLILPDDLLAQAEKTDFLLDGGATGIDVVALDINGQLVWDPSDAKDLCEASGKIEVTLHFIQAKQSSSISSADILSFGDTVRKFLNNAGFEGYPRLAALAAALHYVFDKHATNLKASPHVTLHFVTTAPKAATIDQTVVGRADTIVHHITDLGFIGKVSVKIFGADDLHESWVRKKSRQRGRDPT
jgi:hypothetical protein